MSDNAGVITAGQEDQLNRFLIELQQKTTAQLWIVTVGTTGGIPIEQYSLELAEQWGIGRKGKDNGALILVAVADRAYRIEVGYGLEGALPDAYCDRVARAYFVPNFRQGRYGEGLYPATLDMAGKMAKEHGVEITGMPTYENARRTRSQVDERARRGSGGLCAMAFPIILLLLILSARRRRRGFGGWAWPLLWGLAMSRGGGRSSGGWGGGFGGGGLGGFGGGFGGGGGGFGGGGASGRW